MYGRVSGWLAVVHLQGSTGHEGRWSSGIRSKRSAHRRICDIMLLSRSNVRAFLSGWNTASHGGVPVPSSK